MVMAGAQDLNVINCSIRLDDCFSSHRLHISHQISNECRLALLGGVDEEPLEDCHILSCSLPWTRKVKLP